MELERLEVVFDGDLNPIEEKIAQFESKMDSMLGRVKNSSDKNIGSVEKDFTSFKGFDQFTKQFEKLNSNFEGMLKRMNQSSEKKGQEIGKSLSKGVTSGTIKMSKDVQTALDKVNLKMQQAKAAQNKLNSLQADRNGASVTGNPKSSSRIDEQIAKAQIQMNRSQQEAQSIVRGLKREYDAIPNSLKKIESSMSANEARIESMRSKIKTLNAEMRNQQTETGNFSTGRWKSTGLQDTAQSLKTRESIDKQSANMNKLIAQNDELQQSYAQLEDRSTVLKSALSGVNTELGEQAAKSRMAVNGMRNLSGQTKQTLGFFSRLRSGFDNSIGRIGSLFNRQSKSVSNGTRQMTNSMGGFGRSMKQLWSQLFLFGLLYQGITKLASGLWSAMNTNAQFSSSLNQIKVNLLTAFYPIYTAVMPAINALMSALATLTGYIASFVATLFGTTYSAAKQGAQGLQTAVDAMNDTSTATDGASDAMDKAKEKAKKLQQMLMGFDEINTLSFDDGSDDSSTPSTGNSGVGANPSGIDWSGSEPKTPAWLTNFANKFKEIISKLFDPIKQAWDAQGKKVINAFKYALSEIWGLIQSIGKSFLEVWTNGTGQKFVENLLILFTDLLNIVGDIAGAFKRAWDDNGRGTALIQSYFDQWNAVLEVIHEIASSFRKAWNDDGLGQRILGNLLDSLININDGVKNLADRFKEAWKQGSVGDSILKGVLKIVQALSDGVKRISEVWKQWTDTVNFSPLLNGVDKLVKAFEPLTKSLVDGIVWIFENVLLPLASFVITDLLPVFLEGLAKALDAVNSILQVVGPVLANFYELVLKPIAVWVADKAIESLGFLGDAFQSVADFFTQHGETIQNVLNFIVEAIAISVQLAMAIIDGDMVKVAQIINGIWTNAKDWTVEKWNQMTMAVSDKAKEILEISKQKFSDTANSIKEKAGNAKDWASDKFSDLVSNTKSKFEDIKSATSTKWSEISEKVQSGAETARSKAETAFSTMKENLGKSLNGVKDTAQEVFDKVGGWAKDLPGKIADGLSSGLSRIGRAMTDIANTLARTIGKGVNGIISGVNWVMSTLGAGWRLSSWDVPYFSYAKGTNYHPGGLAMVNDSMSNNWREMFKLPTGEVGMFPNKRNFMTYLPAGTQVLNGNDTNEFTSSIPHYKGGLIDSVKSFFGSISPSSILDRAFESFVNLSGVPEPGASMAIGAAKRIKNAAYSVVSKRIWDMFDIDLENKRKERAAKRGYALGGLVDQFGWYQIAEGNNPEMVVPLSKPQLAFQRINEALDFMGYDSIPDLTMPEVFRDSRDGYSGNSSKGSKGSLMSFTGNGLDGLNSSLLSMLGETVANAIMVALSGLNLGNNSEPIEIILEVDSTRLGEVTIKGINQVTTKTGRFPLNI